MQDFDYDGFLDGADDLDDGFDRPEYADGFDPWDEDEERAANDYEANHVGDEEEYSFA